MKLLVTKEWCMARAAEEDGPCEAGRLELHDPIAVLEAGYARATADAVAYLRDEAAVFDGAADHQGQRADAHADRLTASALRMIANALERREHVGAGETR